MVSGKLGGGRDCITRRLSNCDGLKISSVVYRRISGGRRAASRKYAAGDPKEIPAGKITVASDVAFGDGRRRVLTPNARGASGLIETSAACGAPYSRAYVRSGLPTADDGASML